MALSARLPRRFAQPRLLGVVSLVAALACAAYLLFGFGYSYETASGSATVDGVVGPVTTTHGTQSALEFALQNHEYAIVGWVVFIVFLGLLTALAAWWGHPGPVWVAGGLLFILSVLGLLSIGIFVLPVAVLVALTASSLSSARRRGQSAP